MIRAGFFLTLSLVAGATSAAALNDRASISGVTFSDTGYSAESSPSTSIDVVQNLDCNGDGATTTTDIEPFFDSFAHITVTNGLNRSIRFTRFWYRVRTSSGTFTSRKKAIIGSGLVESGATAVISAIFAHAQSGAKYFIRSSAPISATLGVQNLTVFLSAEDGFRRTVTLKGVSVIDFAEVDRC